MSDLAMLFSALAAFAVAVMLMLAVGGVVLSTAVSAGESKAKRLTHDGKTGPITSGPYEGTYYKSPSDWSYNFH